MKRNGIITACIFAAILIASLGADDNAPVNDSTKTTPRSRYTGDDFSTVRPGEHTAYNQRQTLLWRGQRVYEKYCIGCHGEQGDGQGVAAPRLITKPRDFTKGIYKFRSTDSSSLPLEQDLHRTITRGLSRVSMPAFPHMAEHDKLAVIAYIKSFYPQWDEQAAQRKVVSVPRAPEDLHNAIRVQRGRAVYLGVGCASCHGVDGAGKGATRIAYVDAWGHPQLPFNFTMGRLKNGDDPEDIYRTFHTGLRSIMPQFGASSMTSVTRQTLEAALSDEKKQEIAGVLDQFPETYDAAQALSAAEREAIVVRNSWDLVAYVLSLRNAPAKGPAKEEAKSDE